MRRMVAVLVLTAFAGPVQQATACSCMVRSAAQQLSAATAVFSGEAVAVSADDRSAIASFAVHAVYKGDVARSVTVRSGGDQADCAVPFQDGVVYVVFAVDQDGQMMASLCGGTTEDRSVLAREGIKPVREYGGAATPGGPGPTTATEEAAPPGSTHAASRSGPIAIAWLALVVAAVLLVRARAKGVAA